MLRTTIFAGENKEALEEVHGKVLASVEGATGLNEDKGILVSPFIKQDENGNSYFTVTTGEEGVNDLEISTDLEHVITTEPADSELEEE